MMAIGPPNDRNAVRSNRWSSTGIGGVRPMALTNGRGSGQIAFLGPRSGCSAAWIGILGILRRPASWRGATTIITSRKLKDAMRRTKGRLSLSAFSFVPSHRDVRRLANGSCNH